MRTIAASIVIALGFAMAPATAKDDASAPSQASALAADGSAIVVGGSMTALAGSGYVTVRSVEASGETVKFVVESAGEAASATLELSGRAARAGSVAVGQSMQVMAIATGHVLVASGKVIAFIPNEAGKALLHHSRVSN